MSNIPACLVISICLIALLLGTTGIICIVKFSDCDFTSECTYNKDGVLVYKGQEEKRCYGQAGRTIHCHWESGKDCPTLDNCKTTVFLIISLTCLAILLCGFGMSLFCFCWKK